MVALLKMPRIVQQAKASDRRIFPRKEVHTWIEGRRLDNSLAAMRDRTVSLALRDVSLGGLSAITPKPIEAGERISVFFPPSGNNRGWDACGRILRCEESAMGYRVAVEFDPLPAA